MAFASVKQIENWSSESPYSSIPQLIRLEEEEEYENVDLLKKTK